MPDLLDTQLLEIPLSKALETYVDPRVMQPGSFTQHENWVCAQTGVVQKRAGYGPMPVAIRGTAATLSTPVHLDTLGGELLAVAPAQLGDQLPHLYSWSPGSQTWVPGSPLGQATVARTSLLRMYPGVVASYVSLASGQIWHVWSVKNGGIYIKAIDAVTGVVTTDDTVLDAMSTEPAPLLVSFALGALWVVSLWLDQSGTGSLKYSVINSGTLGGTQANLVTSISSLIFDAYPLDASRFVVVYVARGALTTIVVQIYNVSSGTPVLSAGTTVVTGTYLQQIAVCGKSGGAIYVSVADQVAGGNYSATVVALHDTTLAVIFAPVAAMTTVNSISTIANGIAQNGNVITLIEGVLSAGSTGGCFGQTLSPTGVNQNLLILAYQALSYTRPFLYNGRLYAVLQAEGPPVASNGNSPLWSAVLVLLDEPGQTTPYVPPVAAILLRNQTQWNSAGLPKRFSWALDAQTFTVDQEVVTAPYSTGNAPGFGVDALTFRLGGPQPALWQSGNANGDLLLSGGLTTVYDSQGVCEAGFLFPPVFTTAVVTGSGGAGGLAAGTYVYLATWEWTDAHGQLHQSAPSNVQSVVVAGGVGANQVQLTWYPLVMTGRGTGVDGVNRDVTLAVFRTDVGASTPYYRLTPRLLSPTDPKLVKNARTSATITYLDTTTSAPGVGLGLVYTDGLAGSTLPSVAAPPSNAVVVHKNRLWLASAEDSKAIWFSKLFVPGEFPGFNDAMTVRLDDSPEGVTALAALDAVLVAFTPSRVYFFEGDGPDDTGQNGQFIGPFLLTSETGCAEPRSVVSYSGGVLFLAKAGFYLLDRYHALSFVGAHVQAVTQAYPVVLAAQVDAARQRIYWLCADAAGANQRIVVYDFGHDLWHTWRLAGGSTGILCQTIWQGKHHYGDVAVYEESYGTQPADDAQVGADTGVTTYLPVASTIASPWIRPGAIAGFQRARRLVLTGTKVADCTLTVQIFADFNEVTPVQTTTIDLTATGSDVGLPVFRHVIRLVQQKCTALKVVISDTSGASVNTPKGIVLAGITLQLGVKKSWAHGLPAGNRS